MSESAAGAFLDPGTEKLKVPPHSIEAEQSVLGGLMLDNLAWEKVVDILAGDDFYRRDHRLIFSALTSLADSGQPCDVVTVSEWLETRKQLEDAGGLSYLGALANNTPSAANVRAYAEIVRERSVMRQLIGVGSDIVDSVFSPEGRDSKQLLDAAETRVFEIAEQTMRGRAGPEIIKRVLTRVVDKVETLFQASSTVTGVPTGWDDFDDRTSGMQAGDLVIVAGRPSMGKTTFAMNIAEHAVMKEYPVLVFSMEMPADQLAMRMMSSLGRIDQHKLRTGQLHDDDWPRITSAINMLQDKKLLIDDTPAMSPTEVRARARRVKREHGLGMIVLDYIQLMRGSSEHAENRATEISEISRSLKALAKELEVPVIALSQLNRSLEQRPNKRPVMSDLRESGAIEQDADVIVFIYRDEVYNPESADKGTAEIIIGKQRNGPIGTVRLTFLGKYTRFENWMPESYSMDEDMM
ncbi:MAG: replicative DNA helicase [Gammaproteobacteria bacterium]|nr:replicative DNA helicase [Gammaproteobacteria bacterium]